MKPGIQLFAALAHPADLSGGIADHQGMVGNIFCDDCTGADECIRADGVSANDGAVGAHGSAFLNKRGAHLIHLADFRTRVVDIGKDHRWPAENAVFQGYAFIDADVVLYFAFFADYCIRSDDNVLADVAIFANL